MDTENQVVHILTISLGKSKFQKFINMIGVWDVHMIQTL
jgi:hypothetical protein